MFRVTPITLYPLGNLITSFGLYNLHIQAEPVQDWILFLFSRDSLLVQIFPDIQIDISSTQKLKQLTEISLNIFLCTCNQASSLWMFSKCLWNPTPPLYPHILLFLSGPYHLSPGWLCSSSSWCRVDNQLIVEWISEWTNWTEPSLIISGSCYTLYLKSFLNNNSNSLYLFSA